jgi:cellulose synthase/poly-beta-1,6-N-acetylglucosamine synthase-like glycosyltransferase
MLTHLVYLSAIWLLVALFLAILLGTRIRRASFPYFAAYLVLLILLGDIFALRAFATLVEVSVANLLAIIGGLILGRKLPDWNAPGKALLLFALTTTALYLAYALALTAFGPLNWFAFLFSFLFFLLQAATLLVSLSYLFEILDVLCRVRWHRIPQPIALGEYVPFVSLHVPAYNEPPELVEKTLRALGKLEYPRFEVILVDNNTPQEKQWRPLVSLCRELGFKFVHLERWPGYKSGALNFALSLTDPRAEIVGVIDADYIVEPDYLRSTVPYFADPQLAFVQTPQDYREFSGNHFFEAAYDAYKYFFEVGMPCRNEYNAIIFGGTMGLLRKRVLQEIGGWDEWCITEDAEASLRILSRGYTSLYINRTFGRGLMPLNFEGLKKQRFRWAFGGIQILRKHWDHLMPWAHWLDPHYRLTFVQRYFYLSAGLQWFNELLTFLFTIILLASALLAVTGHSMRLFPIGHGLVVISLVIISTNLLRALWALQYSLHLSWKKAWLALTSMLSLSWVVALACLEGAVRARGVFLRTPKVRTRLEWVRSLRVTALEATLGLLSLCASVAAAVILPSGFAWALAVFALFQALIYLSAPLHSFLSLRSVAGRQAAFPSRGEISGRFVSERGAGFRSALIAAALVAVVLFAANQPQPEAAHRYSVLSPDQLLPGKLFEPFTNPTSSSAGSKQTEAARTPIWTITAVKAIGPFTATRPADSATPLPKPSPGNPGPLPAGGSTSPPPSATSTEPPGHPVPTNPVPTRPAPTNPAPTNPPPTNPAPTNPAPTNPAPTNPAPTNPAPTNPAPTNPAPTHPAPTNPPPTHPAPTNPAPTNPAPTHPAPTKPAPTTPAPPHPTPTHPPPARSTTPRVPAHLTPLSPDTYPAVSNTEPGSGGFLAFASRLWESPDFCSFSVSMCSDNWRSDVPDLIPETILRSIALWF